MRQKRIGILYPVDYLDVVPCVQNTIIMLAKHGFVVEVFVLESDDRSRIDWLAEEGAVIHTLPPKAKRGSFLRHVPNLPVFAAWALNRCRGKDFLCFVGVDPPGLVAAALLGKVYHRPWVYFSLELIISTDPFRMYRNYKPLEVRYSRGASLIITQDEMRARLMAEDNKIPMHRFVYLPNSPLGPASREKTDFLQNKFGFDDEDRILLYAGGLGGEFMSRELALASLGFPGNWKIVFQCRGIDNCAESHLADVFCKDKHFLSPHVSYRYLRRVIASAHIGVALYNFPSSPNFLYIGKAAGKLCHYLRCGLPVIATRMPWWDETLRHYHSGVSVESPSEIKMAAELIFADYDRFSEGAVEHFNNELRFEPAFDEVLSRLIALA